MCRDVVSIFGVGDVVSFRGMIAGPAGFAAAVVRAGRFCWVDRCGGVSGSCTDTGLRRDRRTACAPRVMVAVGPVMGLAGFPGVGAIGGGHRFGRLMRAEYLTNRRAATIGWDMLRPLRACPRLPWDLFPDRAIGWHRRWLGRDRAGAGAWQSGGPVAGGAGRMGNAWDRHGRSVVGLRCRGGCRDGVATWGCGESETAARRHRAEPVRAPGRGPPRGRSGCRAVPEGACPRVPPAPGYRGRIACDE